MRNKIIEMSIEDMQSVNGGSPVKDLLKMFKPLWDVFTREPGLIV